MAHNGSAALQRAADLPTDPVEAARAAHLRYVTDDAPGIQRRRRRGAFVYSAFDGAQVRDEAELERIHALAIPPAWTDVWICPNPRGHLQATGRDARGRKQYRYHPRWRAARDETKFERMVAFGEALPGVRERTAADMAQPGLSRTKVLAAIVRLLDATLIRVGNEEYARDNHSFGLTTMRDRHVSIEAATLRFEFRGKHGIKHVVDLKDRKLARIVKQCRDIPGQELFQYLDDEGQRHGIESADVNDYLREITGEDFTAKDFRTWAGTVLAAQALAELGVPENDTQAKHHVVEAVERVARRLGNTPAVCRKCYVHPAVVEAYLSGAAVKVVAARASAALRQDALDPAEAAVLRYLRAHMHGRLRAAA